MVPVAHVVGFMCRSSQVKAYGEAAPTTSTSRPGILARKTRGRTADPP